MAINPSLTDRGGEVSPECGESSRKNNSSSKPLDIVSVQRSSSPDDVVPSSSPNTITSVEASGPPSPREGAIPNFGAIDEAEGIYRSSFPLSCNIKHLESLKLKTIVTLVPTAFDTTMEQWLASSNVQHFRIKIPAHKSSEDTIPMESIAQVMKLMTDETKRPILIHCNKGKHRTGCMTACFRKLHGMDDLNAVTEYHEYARPKARDYDLAFIIKTDVKDIAHAISNLAASAEPIDHHHPHYNSDDIRVTSAAEVARLDVDVTDGEGSRNAEECIGSVVLPQRLVTGRLIITPRASISPPFSTAFDLGFTASDLTDALSSIKDGQDLGALSPPHTPLRGARSECSESADEYS